MNSVFSLHFFLPLICIFSVFYNNSFYFSAISFSSFTLFLFLLYRVICVLLDFLLQREASSLSRYLLSSIFFVFSFSSLVSLSSYPFFHRVICLLSDFSLILGKVSIFTIFLYFFLSFSLLLLFVLVPSLFGSFSYSLPPFLVTFIIHLSSFVSIFSFSLPLFFLSSSADSPLH